jgi:hypothetical protein
MNIYVSGSIRDIPYVRSVQNFVESYGHKITHDWTAFTGAKDDASEAGRQMIAIDDCEHFICILHPRLKAGWIELGVALAWLKPITVINHREITSDMWLGLSGIERLRRKRRTSA